MEAERTLSKIQSVRCYRFLVFRVYYLLQEKLLAIRVLEEHLLRLRDDEGIEPNGDLNSFERELIYRLEQERIKKEA